MAKSPDFLRTAITQNLAPLLIERDFYRLRPKLFVRIRGEMVDCLGFQTSTLGTRTFHVHSYVNLLSHPQMNLDAYQVGTRFSQAPNDGAKWCGANEETATAAIESVVETAKTVFLPWFDGIASVHHYIIAYIANPEHKTLENLAIAIALLHAGHSQRPWWICDALQELERNQEPLEEHEQETVRLARALQEGIDSPHGFLPLLERWRQENIAKFKLEALIQKNLPGERATGNSSYSSP